MSCTTPLLWETLVAYWADDLPAAELDATEQHLMACGACNAAAERVAQLTHSLRALLPPLLSPERLEALRQSGLRVHDNPMQPGERRQVVFPTGVDILLHRLGGLDLTDAERVRFRLSDERTGSSLVELPEVPFDRGRGELLLACQLHYAFMPHDTVADLQIERRGGATQLVRYTILHVFP